MYDMMCRQTCADTNPYATQLGGANKHGTE